MIKRLFGSQLRLNMASGVVVTVAHFLIMLISYPIYLSYLGYESYGVWLILATVLTFLELGGNLGIEAAVTKFVAEEYGRQNTHGIGSYMMMALLALSTSGIIGFILLICLKAQIISLFNLTGDNAEISSQLLPYIGLLCIYVFVIRALRGTLSGLGRMDIANYIGLMGRIVLLGVAVLLLYAGLGVVSLLIGNIASYIVIHVLSVILIRRVSNVRLLRANNWDWQRLKKLLSFGIGIVGGSISNMLISPFNKLMLSKYVGVGSIPIYEIAYRGSMQVRGLAEVGFRALMPEISRINAHKSDSSSTRISKIYRRSIKLVFFGGIPVFVFGMLIVSYTPVLRLWLGSKFTEELPATVCIMLLATTLGLIGVPAYYTLIGLGRVRHSVTSHIIQASLNAGLVITVALVTSSLSVTKVTWAIAIAMGASTLYLIWQAHHVMLHRRTRGL